MLGRKNVCWRWRRFWSCGLEWVGDLKEESLLLSLSRGYNLFQLDPREVLTFELIEGDHLTSSPVQMVVVGGMTLPSLPLSSLSLTFQSPVMGCSGKSVDLSTPPLPYPLQEEGGLLRGRIQAASTLTHPQAIKTTLQLTISLHSGRLEFEPGDAIGIVCPNPEEEVEMLLERLGCLEMADQDLTLQPSKVKTKLPSHLPHTSTTLRNIFLYYTDIRTTPKKSLLRLLGESATEPEERLKLLQLSSKEGAALFQTSVRTPSLSILDILLTFPSSKPKVETLIEHLPRLSPRPYSIASSPLDSKDQFTIAFNLVEIPEGDGRLFPRRGICTGWLYELARNILHSSSHPSTNKDNDLSTSSPLHPNQLVFYKRKNHNFRLPSELSSPVIMVGPGCGVAPFMGFLAHRSLQKSTSKIGPMHLYFGCRNRHLDFLFQEEMNSHLVRDGVLTRLCVAYSREEGDQTKYVQDLLWEDKEVVVRLLLDEGACMYVCGDGTNMARDLKEKLLESIQQVQEVTREEAQRNLKDLQSSKRYLEDVWS